MLASLAEFRNVQQRSDGTSSPCAHISCVWAAVSCGGLTVALPSDWTIPAAEIAKRTDMRAKRIFSIDPPSARDLDDALHITVLPGASVACTSGIV